MYYSNNKHVLDTKPLDTPTPISELLAEKAEKKEKKQKIDTFTNPADYGLKHRSENYYIAYMDKETKERFKNEINMKYILDSVKPHLRGWDSVKAYSEDTKKNFLPTLSTPNLPTFTQVIQEVEELPAKEQEESPRKEATLDHLHHHAAEESASKGHSRSPSGPNRLAGLVRNVVNQELRISVGSTKDEEN